MRKVGVCWPVICCLLALNGRPGTGRKKKKDGEQRATCWKSGSDVYPTAKKKKKNKQAVTSPGIVGGDRWKDWQGVGRELQQVPTECGK